MWCTKTGKCRHQINAIVALQIACQILSDICRMNDAETIAQPLHCCAGNKNGTLKCIGSFTVKLIGDGAE
jgi:hypothetical protein